MPEFVEFSRGTSLYARVLTLRSAVLREPLGLRYKPEDLADEQDQWHFALVEGDTPLACVIAAPQADGVCKLRQMAVAPDRQGEGFGRRLIEQVEQTLRSRGVRELTLHARATAIGFYERLGYEAVGDEFVEVTLPHQAMRKRA